MKITTPALSAVAGMLIGALAGPVLAQTPPPALPTTKTLAASAGLMVYPAKGQALDQQTKDETECYNWSKTQSGYDPMNPPTITVAPPAQAAAPPPSQPSGARARGAVRGAAAGAVIGEVADNDAGKGAAIGATAGVVAGGRQARQQKAQAQQQAEQQAAQQQQANTAAVQSAQKELSDKFKGGMSMCLTSRGYNVK